jgi:hypothetical protein
LGGPGALGAPYGGDDPTIYGDTPPWLFRALIWPRLSRRRRETVRDGRGSARHDSDRR